MQGIRSLFTAGRTRRRTPVGHELARPLTSSQRGRRTARREPTLYQRCLAVHIYHAGPRSALQ